MFECELCEYFTVDFSNLAKHEKTWKHRANKKNAEEISNQTLMMCIYCKKHLNIIKHYLNTMKYAIIIIN